MLLEITWPVRVLREPRVWAAGIGGGTCESGGLGSTIKLIFALDVSPAA